MTATTTEERPTTITTRAVVGEDGVLKLDVAPGYYEIVLVRTTPKPLTPHPAWPPGFFEQITIDDPTFKRHPQPMSDEYPPPDLG